MSIKERLKTDLITAMKAKEQAKVETIRFVNAAIKRVEVDTRKDLDDAAVIGILMNLAKQRRDSIDQFRKGGREDLASKEESELQLLQTYLPKQMSSEELGFCPTGVVVFRPNIMIATITCVKSRRILRSGRYTWMN